MMNTVNIKDIQKVQPIVTLNTFGGVANGKSSLIRFLTGINPMKFKKEIVKNMTIKLGYTNAIIYKCNNCENPNCFQINKQICEYCNFENEQILHISIIDAPGHNDLQTTALKSIDLVDFCLLLFSVEGLNNSCTSDHYNALKYYDLLDKTFILQNKIDLISKDLALEQFEIIQKNYDIDIIVPISAQYGYGIDYLIQLMIEKIKIPTNIEYNKLVNENLRATIIRSFDINKQNIDVKNIVGAVIGVHIKKGVIRIGDKIKIIPGLIMKDGHANQLTAIVKSIKTDENEVQIAYPGGLFGIGLSIDANLSKNNKLEGNLIIKFDDTTIKQFKEGTIILNNNHHQIKVNMTCVVTICSQKRNIKISKVDKNKINFISNILISCDLNEKIIILINGKIHSGGYIESVINNENIATN